MEPTWTVPADRMKAGKEHQVPLARRYGDYRGYGRDSLRRSSFSRRAGGQRLNNMSMLMLLRRMGRGDLTVHGFRSAFSDWCAEQTNFASEVREMALAHAVGDKVEAAYRRGDLFQKRRQLAEAWARYCETWSQAALLSSCRCGRVRHLSDSRNHRCGRGTRGNR